MKQRPDKKARITNLFRVILPAAVILAAGIMIFLGTLVYRVVHPAAVPEAVNPSYYLLPSLDIAFPSGDGSAIPGWWIPGLRDAPGIILVPGYGMNRSDALSLAAVLHENGFNVLIYDQRGNGVSPRGASTFGLYETEDLLKAIQFMRSRPEINHTRLGIWGVDVGALAALKAAASAPEVRAIAADGAFESAFDFLDLRISEDIGLNASLLNFGCRQIFGLIHLADYSSLTARLPLQALSDRTVLFIQGQNRQRLGLLTSALYKKIQPQKEMISLETSRIHLMGGENLKNYDRRVANFFHENLQ